MSGEARPRLRRFRDEDAEPVRAMICRTIDACYTGVYPESALEFFRDYHSVANIRSEAASGRTFVLELAGRVVGVGALVGNTIKRVFVDPEFQHRGLGRMLMARLEKEARAAGVRTVELHASLPSKRLYEFLGYRAGARRCEPGAAGEKLYYFPMSKQLA